MRVSGLAPATGQGRMAGMTELSVTALEARLQKDVESAQAAFARGDDDRVIDVCTAVLRDAPGCLPVRKLLRTAQQRRFDRQGGLLSKTIGGVTAVPFLLSGRSALKRAPLKAVESAERAIATSPHNPAGHRLLGEAADALGWQGTAVFAWQCALETDPGEPEIMLGLAGAWLAAGQPAEAVEAAQRALRIDPHNPRAQQLLKDASVGQSLKQGGWEKAGDFRGKVKR